MIGLIAGVTSGTSPIPAVTATDAPPASGSPSRFHYVTETTADALVAAVGVTEETDGNRAVHTAVNVGRLELNGEVVSSDNLRLYFGACCKHPMPFAFFAERFTGRSYAVPIVYNRPQFGRAFAAPDTINRVFRGGFYRLVDVRLNCGRGLRNKQRSAVFFIPALYGCAGVTNLRMKVCTPE